MASQANTPQLSKLRAALVQMEVPDCKCESAGPCPHTLSADHQHDLNFWAGLLQLCFPAHYAEPPPPSSPALVLSRRARVAVLANRRAANVGLWHPDDLVNDDVMELGAVELRIGAIAENEPNGALQYSGRLVDSNYQGTHPTTSRRAA